MCCHPNPLTKPQIKFPTCYMIYSEHSYTCTPPIYVRGHKVSKVSSEIDQSFHIDLLKRSVNTEINVQVNKNLSLAPGYEILSDTESQ
jgi:hypothetical protein